MSTDVTFTYKSGGKHVTKTLKAADKISSREALGLWKVDGKAWKVYATTKQLQALSDDYTRASQAAALPMGDPKFQQGSVKQGTKPASEGFVLITQWMDGTNFQKTIQSFKTALTRQNISHNKTSEEYKRITRGCNAANQVGLKDCQGFIKSGIAQPLRFIDIHTSWNPSTHTFGHSEQAAELVEAIVAWGQ
ncbi:hypothetical protein OBBRIDRAFT_872009 [Obba rivulosa]|uniref:Uncharacterized protein n=1 Tax=Obba rivulosa TaxID=1052685 RepID=A0A8E2AGI1_9APHY|nr:hypothetical protein OBBRIDRAFT_872009 [Obba rivulosa]